MLNREFFAKFTGLKKTAAKFTTNMVFNHLPHESYTAPSCTLIILDTEADICYGDSTNTAGNGYNDDNELDDLG